MKRQTCLVLAAVMVVALVAVPMADAGRFPGPGRDVRWVGAYGSVTYTATFRAGEPAAATVVGNGNTNLDVYVYDENGFLVAWDENPTDDCVVRWRPRWTGTFVVTIVNRGPVFNRYVLKSN